MAPNYHSSWRQFGVVSPLSFAENMSGEDLSDLNSLLNSFTTKCVQLRRERKTEALKCWKPIVEDILGYVKTRKECFAALQIFNSGSYYEKTKVREPDEFDLMLVMNNVEFYELTSPRLSKPPTGKYILTFLMRWVTLGSSISEYKTFNTLPLVCKG